MLRRSVALCALCAVLGAYSLGTNVSGADPKPEPKSLLDKLLPNKSATATEPGDSESRRPFYGLLFPSSEGESASIRAQAADPASAAPADPAAEPIPNDRVLELSDAIGRARINAATADIVVLNESGQTNSEGVGVAVHYNAEHREALFVVSARLFDGVDVESSEPRVTARIYYPHEATFEETIGQCVYCDPKTGLALVAALASRSILPVAFLPTHMSLTAGEEALEFARDGNKFVSFPHEVLEAAQPDSPSEGSGVNGPSADVPLAGKPFAEGAGCFARRNGRLYFAGLCSLDAETSECFLTPTSALMQALVSNRNLAAVYRDQISGKFDTSASREEINFAMGQLSGKPTQQAEQEPIEQEPVTTLSELTMLQDEPIFAYTKMSPYASEPVATQTQTLTPTSTDSLISPEDPLAQNALTPNAEPAQPATASVVKNSPNAASIPVFQPEQAAQSAPRQIPPHIPLIISAQTPEGETVQYVLSPAHNISAQQQTNAAPSGVRSTGYDNQPDPETVAAYEREEEAFNAAIDALRRRAMEGAEILCIVTWPGDAAGDEPRETEVVRLPKRMIANPYAPKSNVELVGASAQERAVPDGKPQGSFVPFTASAQPAAAIK
jgi:hypothetical protein